MHSKKIVRLAAVNWAVFVKGFLFQIFTVGIIVAVFSLIVSDFFVAVSGAVAEAGILDAFSGMINGIFDLFNGKISGAARQAELQQKIAAMQEKMTEAQDAVEAQEFTASVGGGVVEAKVNGKKEVLSVTIKPEAVDPEDVEMLQDLVVSAVNEALRQANDAMENSMNGVTGGLDLSGFGL